MKLKGAIAFLHGLGIKNIRPALYAWFFNFLFSLFVYWCYYKVFTNAAGESIIAAGVGKEVSIFTFLTE